MPRMLPVLLALLLCSLSPSSAQDHLFHFEETLVLGADETLGLEYLFRNPRHIVTDREDRVYVVDDRVQELRVFSEDGEYLATLGGAGQGPGEFGAIDAVAVSHSSNEIIVADDVNQRFTIFSNESASVETRPYPPNRRMELEQIVPFGSEYAAIARERAIGHEQAADLVHVVSADFDSIHSSTANASAWWDIEDRFAQAQQSMLQASIAIKDESTFLVVPDFYEGRIYQYQRKGGGWTTDVLDGQHVDTPPYVLYDFERRDSAPNPKMVHSGPAGRFVASIMRRSAGLFVLNDGRIVHFTYNRSGEEDCLIVELFDEKGKLLRSGPVQGFSGGDRSAFGSALVWKDGKDRFYLVDKRGDFPVIRRVAFTW